MSIAVILNDHFSRYPAMQIQDVYKLIHQAVLGSEHAITSADGPRKWMERELAEMGAGPDEPLLDPISADEQIVRVHLRPFVAQGGNSETLLDAFIRTANEFQGNNQILETYWQTAVDLHIYPAKLMDEFIRSMQAKNYPAVHHSEIYENEYRPAYRVVLRNLVDG